MRHAAMLPKQRSPVILRPTPMNSQPPRRVPRRWALAAMALVILFVSGFTVVRANVLGMGERFDRWAARVEAFIDPPPDRSTIPDRRRHPGSRARRRRHAADADAVERAIGHATPSPTPLVRAPVDVNLVADARPRSSRHRSPNKDCAVAGTQMVLTILGLGNTSPEFQTELHDRIGEWESWEDSHDGGWGPAAVSIGPRRVRRARIRDPCLRLPPRRAARRRHRALRDGQPVVLFPWWGAHTWVMTGYRADADPAPVCRCERERALHPRPVVPALLDDLGPVRWPGQLRGPRRDGAQLAGRRRAARVRSGRAGLDAARRATYPDRDGKYVILVPTIPLDS